MNSKVEITSGRKSTKHTVTGQVTLNETFLELSGVSLQAVVYSATKHRLQPTITFEQYRATYQLVAAAKPKMTEKRSWQECTVLAVACLVLGLAPHFPAARTPAFTLYAVLILCWVFCKPLARRSREKQLKRFYADEQARLNDQVLTIDESGISCDQGNGQATSHLTWQAFTRLIDVADAFVFLPSPNTFARVPKETLTPSDQELIRTWSSTVPHENAK
ncbi:MAG: YcxB family protein [Candidatus Acidiferrales bacterium]